MKIVKTNRLLFWLMCLTFLTMHQVSGQQCTGNYLSASGNKLYDAQGKVVRLTGINWFGFETSNRAPHGLWSRDCKSMLMQIKDLGFNSIRIPWSNAILEPGATMSGISTAPVPDPYTGRILNEVEGSLTDPLDLLDLMVDYCQELNLKIILDNHSRQPDGYLSEELWYTDITPHEKWIEDWVFLADRYKNKDAVIAMDINNEPHGKNGNGSRWGSGDIASDWRLAAEACGDAILAVNPNVLIMVEGVEEFENETYWWGGNLKGAASYPVRLSDPSKLVYSPHEYGPTVFQQTWFSDPTFPDNMPAIWEANFNYLHTQNISPLYAGEFGIKTQGGVDEVWFDTYLAFMGDKGYSWSFWCWNPNSGDTGGILTDDWSSIHDWKMNKLIPHLDAEIPNGTGTGCGTTFEITAAAGSGGSISPVGSVVIPENSDRSFVITASSGYAINDVQVDGVSVGNVSNYTFSNVTANHTISASFVLDNTPSEYPTGSPVAINGKLSVSGNQMVNECGNAIQLRGMSTHGPQWFENCYTTGSLDALVNDWGIDIFRIAMYVEEGGYVNNPDYWKNWIDNIVDECAVRGIYCMIDWHVLNPGDPNANIVAARDFWSYMSAKHTGKKHVIYEIANEPNGVTWPQVKTYAEDIIPRIRANDPNTIVIVGTPTWSQDVDVAAADPLNYSNLMYALHFYSGTHTDWLRAKGNTALNAGLALFVTEFGTSQATGDGGPYLAETQNWMDWMSDHTISWINWSFADKAEVSAALVPGACSSGSWNNTSTSGAFIKDHILVPADNFACGGTGNQDPVAVVTASPQTGEAPLSVLFDASGSSDPDGDALSYAWSFGDNSSGTGVSPGHIYTNNGSYTATVTVTDNKGGVGQASVVILVTGGSTGCDFGTPAASPLATGQNAYNYAHVLGAGGPDLSNVSNFAINWDLENNGLWQISMNTSNGIPDWWIDLRTFTTHTFNSTQPDLSFSGTGFPGLDGDYYVNYVGDDLVMVSKTGSYTIYYSNSATPPDCGPAGTASNRIALTIGEGEGASSMRVYPNPFTDVIQIEVADPQEVESIGLFNQAGQRVESLVITEGNRIKLRSDIPGGMYLLKINTFKSSTVLKVMKQ